MHRLRHIDFLRFVAAAAVVYQHVIESSQLKFVEPTLQFAPGVFGVVLFFLVSGLVIPFSVKDQVVWRDFAIRRVFRVFPAYLFCLAIIASLAALGQNHFSQVTAQLDAFAWVANLLIIQDYVGRPAVLGVSWTLPLEFAWYALFLGYALTAGRRYIAELSIGFSILILIVAVASMLADARLPLGRVGMINAALLGYALFGLHKKLLSRNKFFWATVAFIAATIFSQWVTFAISPTPTSRCSTALCGWLGASAVFLLFTLVQPLREGISRQQLANRKGRRDQLLDLSHASDSVGPAFAVFRPKLGLTRLCRLSRSQSAQRAIVISKE